MGARAILLIAAVVLFLIGAFGDDTLGDVSVLHLGLACLAGSALVGELPARRRL
jgi:hypothetical protein